MNGVRGLVTSATIAFGTSAILLQPALQAAIMVSPPFDIVVPEAQPPGPASIATGPFNVANLDPNFTATITALVPSATFVRGDATDFVETAPSVWS